MERWKKKKKFGLTLIFFWKSKIVNLIISSAVRRGPNNFKSLALKLPKKKSINKY